MDAISLTLARPEEDVHARATFRRALQELADHAVRRADAPLPCLALLSLRWRQQAHTTAKAVQDLTAKAREPCRGVSHASVPCGGGTNVRVQSGQSCMGGLRVQR